MERGYYKHVWSMSLGIYENLNDNDISLLVCDGDILITKPRIAKTIVVPTQVSSFLKIKQVCVKFL